MNEQSSDLRSFLPSNTKAFFRIITLKSSIKRRIVLTFSRKELYEYTYKSKFQKMDDF